LSTSALSASDFGRATFRFFGKTLSGLILGIGFLMAGVTARKQALHDLLAGTFVVFRGVNPGEPIPDLRPPMPWYGWLLNGALLAYPMFVAAVALPAYENYMTRAQVIEGVIASDAAKTAVAEFYIDKSRCPLSAAEAGLDGAAATSLRYVDSVTVEPDCSIVVTFASSNTVRSSLRGQRVEMTGRPNADGVLGWTCSGTMAPQLLPSSCRSK
jgi:Tfp pilus assembly major pilin PilA